MKYAPELIWALCLVSVVLACARFVRRLGRVPSTQPLPWFTTEELVWVALLPIVCRLILYAGVYCYERRLEPALSIPDFFLRLNRWDAEHYLMIARQGYVTTGFGQKQIVFLPLFPLLLKGVSLIAHIPLEWAGLTLNTLLAPVLSLGIYKLARFDYSMKRAKAAVLLLVTFPIGFFLAVTYTETLYLTLVVYAFFFARLFRWWDAGICALFAGLTKTSGYFLFPALLYEYYVYQKKEGVAWRWNALSLLAPIVALALYLGLNQSVYGDPFKFLFYQRTEWHREVVPFWTGLLSVIRVYDVTDFYAFMTGRFAEAVGSVAALAMLLPLSKSGRVSYGLFCLFSVLYFLSSSWILSTPRYTMVLFPFYFVVAESIGGWRRLFWPLALIFLGLQGLYLYWFSIAKWAF